MMQRKEKSKGSEDGRQCKPIMFPMMAQYAMIRGIIIKILKGSTVDYFSFSSK